MALLLLAVLLLAACVRLDHWLRTPHAPPTQLVSMPSSMHRRSPSLC